MIEKNKFNIKKLHKYSNHTKKNKNNHIYKILYLITLFLIAILIFINNDNNNNNKLQKEIENEIIKDIDKIIPIQYNFTLDDVKKDFENIINKYKYLIKKEKNIKENCPIWTMWYQGIEAAPPIVRSCIQSIIENRVKHPVIIITKYNIDKYIKLPYYIMEKFNKNIITLTHFSDIVRIALLFKYGGYWIDPTYLITTPITKVVRTFDTLHLDYCFTNSHPFVKCIWTVNYMAVGKNSFIAVFAYHALFFYWKKYNYIIDYYLIDYIIHIAYYNVQEFKNNIDRIPYLVCDIFLLLYKLNSEYNKINVCHYNKLNRREFFPIVHQYNITSHYDYIIERYRFDFQNKNKDYILNI